MPRSKKSEIRQARTKVDVLSSETMKSSTGDEKMDKQKVWKAEASKQPPTYDFSHYKSNAPVSGLPGKSAETPHDGHCLIYMPP